MLSDEVIEKVIERLINRIEQANTYVLKKIGKNIKKLDTITPSDVYRLEQLLKFGGDYDKIVNKLAEITELNVKDIKKIFNEVAKTDYYFAEKFYNFRNIKQIPFDENTTLKNHINALANITAGEYMNMSNTSAIGFSVKDLRGQTKFQNLGDTYQRIIDEGILSVSTGKSTFDEEMHRIIKQVATSGLKTVDFASGRSMRLDSSIRMLMRGAIRNLHNELQQQFGKEFDSDGVEISVHLNPAPDHAEVQGRQFSNEEFDKFQNDQDAISYDGIRFPAISEETGHDRRAISQYNCYHYIFSIILGVSKPAYTNEQLKDIINHSKEAFMFDGKKYTMYEGTQLQRQLETEIRKQKDIQIIGRESRDQELVGEAQDKITKLTKKYKQLSEESGLPTKADRLRVSGYKRVNIKNIIPKIEDNMTFVKWQNYFKNKYKNVEIADSFANVNKQYIDDNLIQFDKLIDKYPIPKDNTLKLKMISGELGYDGYTTRDAKELNLSGNFKFKDDIIENEIFQQEDNFHIKVNKKDYDIYTLTHEYGHVIEFNYANEYLKTHKNMNLRDVDFKIKDKILNDVALETGLEKYEIIDKYFSNYAKSMDNFEWFAELFTQIELGQETPVSKALKKWIQKNIK